MKDLPYEAHLENWRKVLPDGTPYNHWGGRSINRHIVALLKVLPSHSVLDVCCGEGGTLADLPNVKLRCGIDVSLPALTRFSRYPDRVSVNGDAHHLPFKDHSFDTAYAQDADAWLQGDAFSVLSEVRRVLRPSGLFLLQNYVQSSDMPQEAIATTERLLRLSGFAETSFLIREEIEALFASAGFNVRMVQDLHEIYASDNARMLTTAMTFGDSHSLLPLLEWEANLFAKRWWTGVLILAYTGSPRNASQLK